MGCALTGMMKNTVEKASSGEQQSKVGEIQNTEEAVSKDIVEIKNEIIKEDVAKLEEAVTGVFHPAAHPSKDAATTPMLDWESNDKLSQPATAAAAECPMNTLSPEEVNKIISGVTEDMLQSIAKNPAQNGVELTNIKQEENELSGKSFSLQLSKVSVV